MADGTLSVDGNASGTFAGTIEGGGTFLKYGSGTLTLTADNPYTGVAAVYGGTLLVNGAQPASPVQLVGGTLGGSGSVGAITGLGTVAPGAAPGATAILHAADVTLSPGATLALDLTGVNPGTDNDQLDATGVVTLGKSRLGLHLAPGFAVSPGQSFVLINNDGADAVNGTFAGLPQDAYFQVAGQTFRITYTGGTGNDVVLIRENGPAVISAAYDPVTAPRLKFAFTQDVRPSLSAADLAIRNLDNGATIDPATFSFAYDANSNTATFTHAAGPLPDGNYRVTLDGAGVANTAAQAVGAVTTLDFFALAGDANRDRAVDFNDLVALAQNYNTSDKTLAQGDFNYDGRVDFNDLVLLAQRYNTSLPLPPTGGVLPAPSPVPQSAAALPAVIMDDANRKPVFSIVPVRPPAPIKRRDAIKRKH